MDGMSKITDLEKFVESDIYRPYQTILDEAYSKLSSPVARNLENAKYHLMNNKDFADHVLNRMKEIEYYFPNYIKHELVTYLSDKGAVKHE